MYKKQMKFQRIACFAFLAAAAIVFIYSLGLVTDLYEALYSTMDYLNPKYDAVDGARIFYDIQPFNSMLTTAALILIGCSVLVFITNTHSRRKYYLANYITVGLSCVANLAVAIWTAINVAKYKLQYQTTIDFEALKEYSEIWKTLYIGPNDTFWFDIGFVVSAILIIVSALAVFNLIWKTLLMKEEKRLIKEGLEG